MSEIRRTLITGRANIKAALLCGSVLKAVPDSDERPIIFEFNGIVSFRLQPEHPPISAGAIDAFLTQGWEAYIWEDITQVTE